MHWVIKASQSRKPDRSAFTADEWAIIKKCRTPAQVQRYFRALPYNWDADTLRTLRGVVKYGTANCIEAALSAATIMEQYGHPPLLLDLESVDYLDHIVFLFRKNGRWGSIAKSRDIGLHGRKPLFRTIRHLVMSYVEPYVDGSGRIKGYGVANLDHLVPVNWRLSERNVWIVEKALIAMPHQPLKTSEQRYQRILRKFLAFKKAHPDKPFLFYDNLHQWM